MKITRKIFRKCEIKYTDLVQKCLAYDKQLNYLASHLELYGFYKTFYLGKLRLKLFQ